MNTNELSSDRCKIQLSSEITIDDILNDDEDECRDYYNVTLLEDYPGSRNKVIPTNNDQNMTQTIFIRNRNTWEKDQGKLQWFKKLFKKNNENQMTKAQAIEIRQRELLNDYAYETYNNTCWSTFAQKISKSIKVFDPDSTIYIIWQLLNCFLVMFFFFQIPFMLCFEQLIHDRIELKQVNHSIFDLSYELLALGITIFVIDIFISLNTAFYKEGQLVFDRRQIAKNYTKTYFILDLIPILCLIDQIYVLESNTQYLGFFQLLFIFKIYEIQKTTDMISEYLQLNRTSLAYFRLLEVMLTIVWLCHCFACIFHHVGYKFSKYTSEQQLTRSWINQIDLFKPESCAIFSPDGSCNQTFKSQSYQDSTIFEIYSVAFYWAVTTMASVGYGDVTPKNSEEVWITTISEFISCIVFAFSINAIWEVINESRQSKNRFQKYVNEMERFMHEHKINRKLKTKVEAYMYHLYQTEKVRDIEVESTIFKKLAPGLREELLFDTFGKLFKNKAFFHNFTPEFLKELSIEIEQESFSQGEKIFQQKEEVEDFPFYFIVDGQVSIYLENGSENGIQMSSLAKNTTFGLLGFITGVERSASARCLTYTRLYKLSRIKFLQKLEDYPEDKEKFFQIRHQILFDKSLQSVNLKCYICESRKHLAYECNKTLYLPDKTKIIQKSQNQTNRRNRGFQRSKRIQFQALRAIRDCQAYAHVLKRANVSITFDNDSSEEDNEESSDVDQYEQELKELNIQEMVTQEKEKAELKKQNTFLEDKKYEQTSDIVSIDQSLDINQKQKQQFESDQGIPNNKKKKKVKQVKHLNNIRTSSMISLNPIQERKILQKKLSIESPQLEVRKLRKMTTEVIEQPHQSFQRKGSQQLEIENKQISSIQPKQQSPIKLLKKMKTIKIQQPENKIVHDLIEELKPILNQIQEHHQQEMNHIQEDHFNYDSHLNSDFSIDQMQNYQYFLPNENPNRIIKRLKKGQKRYRKTLIQI